MSNIKEKVFVIDDEQDLLDLYVSLLSDWFDVVSFNNADKALAAVDKEHLPAALVTDIMMPGISGIEFIEKIRAMHINKPVVVVSGFADKQKAIKSLELGVFAIIEKPFDGRYFFNTVKRAVMVGLQNDLTTELLENYQLIAANVQSFLAFFKEGFDSAEEHLKNGLDVTNVANYVAMGRRTGETQNLLTKLENDIKSAQDKYTQIRKLNVLSNNKKDL